MKKPKAFDLFSLFLFISGAIVFVPFFVMSQGSDGVNIGASIQSREPVVITEPATDVGLDKATLNAELTTLGPFVEVEVFFQYREKDAPFWSETPEPKGVMTEPGTFDVTIIGFDKDTTYEFRAGVEWFDGEDTRTEFGFTLEFTTEDDPPPPPRRRSDPVFPEAGVFFSGLVYPDSQVFLLKDAELIESTTSGSDAFFSMSVGDLTGGYYHFFLYSEDYQGRRSSLSNFYIYVPRGAQMEVTDIFIPPTVDVDKVEVKRGDDVLIFGQTVPSSNVTIMVNASPAFYVETYSDEKGFYEYVLNTSDLNYGTYYTKSKFTVGEGISSVYSRTALFDVTDRNIKKETIGVLKGDLNNDRRVNLIDFSIASYWFREALSVEMREIECERLNCDGVIDLVDFSIMAYYWTG